MLSYKLEGLDRLLKKTDPKILAKPLQNFFKRAAITVQGKAREGAPVDTGKLRNSIAYEVDKEALPKFAKVGFLNASEGSDLWYQARAMEFGTGPAGDKAVSHKSSHFPPGAALGRWAHLHGVLSGFAVAFNIFKKGGLKARSFLRAGLKDSVGDIRGFLRRAEGEIKEAWEKR